MSIFDLVYEGFNQHQYDKLSNLKACWCQQDPQIVHPDSIIGQLKEFSDCLGLKTKSEFSAAINPNIGIIDNEMAKLIHNMIAVIKLSCGNQSGSERINTALFPDTPERPYTY